ncbi:hypothetical protein VNI00_009209 [Paramarasmius palmivorus]|uniref:Uncharacterized protein n=1 Tax=Paramarasmius palmivorus TaxID=297713 RepID=A0AAW0CSP5_9AGAR
MGLLDLAQSLDVPPTWRKPRIKVSLDERKNLANAALENAVVPDDIERTLGVQAAISDMDHLTDQTNNRGLAVDFFSRYPTVDILVRAFNMNDSAYSTLLFGYASMQAHTAYKIPKFLQAASDLWNHARSVALLDEDIKSGTRERLLNYDHLQSSCQGETMAGGVGDVVLDMHDIDSKLALSKALLQQQTKSTGKVRMAFRYNALLDLATRDQSNIYAGNWAGPPSSALDKENQISASEVLISGIPLLFTQNATNPKPTPSDQPPGGPGAKTTTTPAGPIVGGVIGGVAIIAAMAVMLVWCRRRYQQLFYVPSLTPFVQDQGDRTSQPNARSRSMKGEIRRAIVPLEPAVCAPIPLEPPPSYMDGRSPLLW